MRYGTNLQSVNAQGVVGGNDDNDHQCQPCLRGACRTTNGIYMRPDLPPGYSLVAQIPKGACGLHVQQLKHTRNILGKFLIVLELQEVLTIQFSFEN